VKNNELGREPTGSDHRALPGRPGVQLTTNRYPEAYECRFLLPIRLAFPTCPRARWRMALNLVEESCSDANRPCNCGGLLSRGSADDRLCSGACLPLCIPSFVRAPLRGLFMRPDGSSLFCFGCAAPSGSRFLPKQVCNQRHKTPRKLLSGPSQKADLRPWEPGPLARLRPV
jgi:hypothetical protein